MCGSTDAVSFTAKNGSVVCTTGCGSGRRSTRVMAEPIPLLIAKKATDAKHATFIFLYCRGSTLFVPPTNLRQRQEVLDNFAEQYFAHLYASTTHNVTGLHQPYQLALSDRVRGCVKHGGKQLLVPYLCIL